MGHYVTLYRQTTTHPIGSRVSHLSFTTWTPYSVYVKTPEDLKNEMAAFEALANWIKSSIGTLVGWFPRMCCDGEEEIEQHVDPEPEPQGYGSRFCCCRKKKRQ